MRMMQALTARHLHLDHPDILITRTPILALPAVRRSVDTVIELHSLPDAGSQTRDALKRLIQHPKLRRIVTISQRLADDLLAEYGPAHPDCDIIVVHDGAEAGEVPSAPRQHPGRLCIGYFGHLYPGKGMETIAALAPRLPEMDFEVYGGTETDITRWQAATAGQKNLRLHGHIPHEVVRARMEACDVLIAPYGARVSHVAGGDIARWMSPLKLFEYMAAGRPIVCSDLPVLREVVTDGKTALLAPPGDIDAWATTLRHLADEPKTRIELGQAGRAVLETEYTWERRAKRILRGLDVGIST